MNDMRQMTQTGRAIESSSFAIIDEECGPHSFAADQWQIVRRIIHATADFEFKDLTFIHPDAVRAATAAFFRGCPIVTDVRMIQVGLNQARLDQYGCKIHCFISDDDVIEDATRKNTTRAIEAMGKAHRLGLVEGAIIAVGNAPTALLEAARLIQEMGVKPALIIGVPVGFVSAVESKELIMQLGVPSIVTRGRKGGSPIAVAILHALLALSVEERH